MEPTIETQVSDPGSLILRRLLIGGIGAVYATLLLLTYQELSKLWSYIGFWYRPPEPSVTATTIVAAAALGFLLPVRSWTVVGFAKWILYFILFIPALIIPPQQGVLVDDELFLLCTLIWISAAAMILFLRDGAPFRTIAVSETVLFQSVLAAWVLGNIAIIAVFGRSMSIVGLEQVYEQRSAVASLGGGAIGYVMGIMSGAVNPFLLVVGLSRKRPLFIALALVGQILIYSTLAGKVVLGSTVLIIGTYMVFRGGKVAFSRIYAGLLTLAVLGPITTRPELYTGGLAATFSDLVYMRILVLPGVLVGVYSEFFQRYPVTHLSHSLIGRPFFDYPYGNESVGQVIGRYVTPTLGDAVNNYNANFIAADGITGFGTWGIPLIFVLAAAWLWMTSKLVGTHNRRVVCAVLTPFVVSLADASLFTAILTGGGAFAALLLYLLRSSEQHGVSHNALPSETSDDLVVAPKQGG
ncbi:hypothetical protein MZO42_13565 [Sphingomonas psychrotolerans]|uniref:Oligosaccharide repeat unit polymerase n=1 Tax=Sphingomonas psychrotolerans TaxID=1327635 RepID=A0ABU3N8N4_9SPHN|nr:hypothetical protein [Sphingomonas psychrotolerans]MDT8759725.1 hypothetical protein [Sphingomonas psychrotolerans]